ncbi:hypothetical protein P3T35_003419 [Kitasatospora sp. GP30]|nr:hypothetical protein [Kitasatospora sp. GP30]
MAAVPRTSGAVDGPGGAGGSSSREGAARGCSDRQLRLVIAAFTLVPTAAGIGT